MKYFVYVLKSINFSKSYVGFTKDLENRLGEHNLGKAHFSQKYAPWEVIYKEVFNDYKKAILREKYLKSASGRRLILKKLFK